MMHETPDNSLNQNPNIIGLNSNSAYSSSDTARDTASHIQEDISNHDISNHEIENPVYLSNLDSSTTNPNTEYPNTANSSANNPVNHLDDDLTTEVPKDSPQTIEPKTSKKPLPIKWLGLSALLIVLLGSAGYWGLVANKGDNPFGNLFHSAEKNSDKTGKGKKDQITPVKVAIATQKTVPIQITAIGNVQSGETVSVTPQATGRITSVNFKKGEDIQQGQLLFEIDNRSQVAAIQQAQGIVAKDQSQVQQARATLEKDIGLIAQARETLTRDQGLVRQARAQLAKDEAQAQFAQAQADRYNNLYKQGAISQDQAQQYIANNKVSLATLQSDREAIANAEAVVRSDEIAIQNAEAVVEGDKAAIEAAQAVVSSDGGSLSNTKVQSSYTKIYAPIAGRAGNILITEGNVVQANSTNPLVIIQKNNPIQVAFSVPEANLSEIQKRMDHGKLTVDVSFAGNPGKSISGVLSFLDNKVDNTTGTIQLIGDFENSQGNLFPGQFVNTTLTLKQETNATVVPSQAVQTGPKGQYVFVVKPDDTVENVPIEAGSSIDGFTVIQKGVQPGDKVVIDGQANLVTGSKISVKDDNSDTNANRNDRGDKSENQSGNTAPNTTTDPTSTDQKPGRSKRRSQKAENRTENAETGNPGTANPERSQGEADNADKPAQDQPSQDKPAQDKPVKPAAQPEGAKP